MNVLIEPPDGGLKNISIVTTSQILTVSRERLERKLDRLGSAKMDAVNRAIRLSLALD
jgi:mRNA-degrading endonuclease toxin of MazEF toxin-antitoxin module